MQPVYIVHPAAALGAEIGNAARSFFASMADRAEQNRRREAYHDFVRKMKDHITKTYDAEAASYVLDRFEASDFSVNFDFSGTIQAFQRKRVYEFAIKVVNETFADAVVDRMQKFARVEYAASMQEIFERSLKQVGYAGDVTEAAARLVDELPRYVVRKEEARVQAIQEAKPVRQHQLGGRTVHEYSDGRFELVTISGATKSFKSLDEVKAYIK